MKGKADEKLAFPRNMPYFCTIEPTSHSMSAKKAKAPKATTARTQPVRHQRVVCLVSEEEMRIIDEYLKKYRITNKSNWMRETLLSFIYKNLDEDYPTLFGEHDMRR